MIEPVKTLKIIILCFLLSACGFQSVYNLDNKLDDKDSYQEELAAIRVKKDRKHINQVLRENIEDIFNPDNLQVAPKYMLTTDLTKTLTSTFTASSGASGRNKVIITVNYKLINLDNGDIVGQGITNAKDDFDVETTRRFANETTQKEIELYLTKVIARNLRNMIIGDFTVYYKNGKKVIQSSEEETEAEDKKKQ